MCIPNMSMPCETPMPQTPGNGKPFVWPSTNVDIVCTKYQLLLPHLQETLHKEDLLLRLGFPDRPPTEIFHIDPTEIR